MDLFNIYLITLRIVHIVGGALWVGAGVYYFAFVEPTVKELGPAGPQFMRIFMERRRVPLFMNIVSSLTVLSGALLFWSSSSGLQTAWLRSGPGIGFSIGSLAAVVVYGIGFFMIRPRAERLGAIGAELAIAGGPPSGAQATELQQLDAEMTRIERVDVALLMIALVTMATARYWTF